MIYDNFDMDFKVAQPVAGHQGLHMSATAATFAPYVDIEPGDLKFTKELHSMSRFNKDLQPDDPKIHRPSPDELLPELEPVDGPTASSAVLDPIDQVFAWNMRAILVEREPAFECYHAQLGLPAEIYALPVRKTEQYPANTINADEGLYDGNWEVLKNLLEQVSVILLTTWLVCV
jgi:hypothetical protein